MRRIIDEKEVKRMKRIILLLFVLLSQIVLAQVEKHDFEAGDALSNIKSNLKQGNVILAEKIYIEKLQAISQKTELDTKILEAFSTIKENQENELIVEIQIQRIEKSLIKVFYLEFLNALGEAEQEYDLNNYEKARSQILKAKDYYFKTILQDKTKGGSPESDELITKTLKEIEEDLSKITKREITKAINIAFVNKVLGEAAGAVGNIEQDNKKAQVKAAETLLYYNIIEEDIKFRLGEIENNAILNSINNLIEEVKNQNSKNAEKTLREIETKLDFYNKKLGKGIKKGDIRTVKQLLNTAYVESYSLEEGIYFSKKALDASEGLIGHDELIEHIQKAADAKDKTTLRTELEKAITLTGGSQFLIVGAKIDSTIEWINIVLLLVALIIAFWMYSLMGINKLAIQWLIIIIAITVFLISKLIKQLGISIYYEIMEFVFIILLLISVMYTLKVWSGEKTKINQETHPRGDKK
jgi:hypothetical protein